MLYDKQVDTSQSVPQMLKIQYLGFMLFRQGIFGTVKSRVRVSLSNAMRYDQHGSIPDNKFIRVVLPAPLGPTIATLEPISTPMLRSFSPKSSLPGYWKLTSFNWIKGGGNSVGSGNSN